MTSDPERALFRSLGPPCTAAGALARGVPGVGPGCSCHTAHLVHLVQPVLVGGQLSHERLVLLPLGVQVAGLVIGHVLGRQHLLIDPELQLDGQRPGREKGPVRVSGREEGGSKWGPVSGEKWRMWGEAGRGAPARGHGPGLIFLAPRAGALWKGRLGRVGGDGGLSLTS